MNGAIDYREYMGNDEKVYIDVNENRTKDGQLVPLSFVWEDGVRYEVDAVIDVRPAASLKAGGVGLRYTVRIRGLERFMFLEDEHGASRWFMERK
jgi:hypothetical protein